MLTIVATVLFSFILIGVGVFAWKKGQATDEEYFLGGRSIGIFATIMTMVFSIWSTLAFYGVIGEAYTNGVGSLGIAHGIFWGSGIQVFIGYKLWNLGTKYHLATPGDFFGQRYYSRAFKFITSAALIYFTMPYIGMQLGGLGSGIQAASGVPSTYGTIFLALVLLIFVSIGGMKSVAWTDAIQGVVFTIIVFVALLALIGGMPEPLPVVMEKAIEARPGLTGYPGPNKLYTPMLNLHLAITFASFSIWPHIFVRYFIAKRKETYKTLSVAFPLYEVLCMVPLLIIGIMVIPYLFGGKLTPLEAQRSIHAAMDFIPGGQILGTGIFLAAFSAAMSTASSQLLACSSMFIGDIYLNVLKREPSQRSIVTMGRILTVIFVIISTFFGLYFPNIFSTATQFATPGYGQLFPALVAGLFWKRANKQGAIIGTVGGFVTLLLTTFVWVRPLGVTPFLWSMLVNVALLVTVSLNTTPPPTEVVDKFFDPSLDDFKEVPAGSR